VPLERTQRFILANDICETLQDSKEETRAKIVMTLVGAPAMPVDKGKKVPDKRGAQSKQPKGSNLSEEFDGNDIE
jgi:hypothetical protein